MTRRVRHCVRYDMARQRRGVRYDMARRRRGVRYDMARRRRGVRYHMARRRRGVRYDVTRRRRGVTRGWSWVRKGFGGIGFLSEVRTTFFGVRGRNHFRSSRTKSFSEFAEKSASPPRLNRRSAPSKGTAMLRGWCVGRVLSKGLLLPPLGKFADVRNPHVSTQCSEP